MPDEHDDTTGALILPVDRAAEALLREIEDDEHGERLRRAATQDLHAAVGVGRQLLGVRRRIAELSREADRFLAEINDLRDPLLRRESDLIDVLERMAIVRRSAGLGNTFAIPAVGTITTRRAPDRWAIDNAAVLAGLAGDDRQELIDPGEPRPPEPKVRGDVLRARLSEMLGAVDVDSSFDEETRGRLLIDAAERIAAAYPGVTFVPGRVVASSQIGES